MIALAPGKLVLSGAYVVLDGSPAVVAAVDRYAVADTTRPPDFVSDEVRAAFEGRTPPHVDVTELRAADRKLGLGSSAAALVAAIAADHFERGDDDLAHVASGAFAAHRHAQGGGSGVDVVASTYGGVLVCRPAPSGPPAHTPSRLPAALVLEAWACPTSASTSSLLATVRKFRTADEQGYATVTKAAREGARIAADLLASGGDDARTFIAALLLQLASISMLDQACRAGIVPPYVHDLAEVAGREQAVFFPSGAGGGDVAIHAGLQPSSVAFRDAAAKLGLVRLDLAFGARGVHGAPPPNLLSTSPDDFPS